MGFARGAVKMIKTKSISKKVLAVILAAVTVIAFTPAIAFTQSAHAATAGSIIVGSQTLTSTSTECAYATTTTTGTVSTPTQAASDPTDWNVKWDGSTLTLNKATINGDADNKGAGIYYVGSTPITIDAERDNTITGADADEAFGLYCRDSKAAITFMGTGSLQVTAGIASSGDSDGILCIGDLKVTGGTLIGTGEKSSSDSSIGIGCGSLSVSGGTVKGTGGEGYHYSKGIAVWDSSTENSKITGGTVEGIGGMAVTEGSYGFYDLNGSINVTGGSLKAIGGTAGSGKISSGICLWSKDQISVDGGTVELAGNNYYLQGYDSNNNPVYGKVALDGVTAYTAPNVDGTGDQILYTSKQPSSAKYFHTYATYKFTSTGSKNCSVTASPSAPVTRKDLIVTIVPDSGCELPAVVEVTSGTTTLAALTGYVYDASTGKVIVKKEYITGDINVKAVCKSAYANSPTVITQPISLLYDIGGAVTPLKVATSDSGAKYQWQQSSDGTTWTNIDGATSPTYTPKARTSGTTKYRCLITGSNGASTYSDAVTITVSSRYAVGAKFTKAPLIYKVTKQPVAKTTSASKNGTVQVVKPVKKTYKSITVPTSIKMNGYTYNVTTIGKKAFYKNSRLKTVTIKSKKITSIGSKAFKGCKKGMTIKVPKSKYKAYKKLLKGKVPAGTKIKKI